MWLGVESWQDCFAYSLHQSTAPQNSVERIQAVEACGYSSGVPKIIRTEDGVCCHPTLDCTSQSLHTHTVQQNLPCTIGENDSVACSFHDLAKKDKPLKHSFCLIIFYCRVCNSRTTRIKVSLFQNHTLAHCRRALLAAQHPQESRWCGDPKLCANRAHSLSFWYLSQNQIVMLFVHDYKYLTLGLSNVSRSSFLGLCITRYHWHLECLWNKLSLQLGVFDPLF